MPADWGDKDLIWTLTSNGRTDQAFGSLWPSWEMDDGVIRANRGMGARGAPADNQDPRIILPGGADLTVTLPDTLTLTAVISDDGIPGRARAQTKPLMMTTHSGPLSGLPTASGGRGGLTPPTRRWSTRASPVKPASP